MQLHLANPFAMGRTRSLRREPILPGENPFLLPLYITPPFLWQINSLMSYLILSQLSHLYVHLSYSTDQVIFGDIASITRRYTCSNYEWFTLMRDRCRSIGFAPEIVGVWFEEADAQNVSSIMFMFRNR
jgi:hypothetical protein